MIDEPPTRGLGWRPRSRTLLSEVPCFHWRSWGGRSSCTCREGLAVD